MSWFKFSKDYTNLLLMEKELRHFTNGKSVNQPNPEENPESPENQLDKKRHNSDINYKYINEANQPVRTKATGQGADYKQNQGKDLPMYGDNFTDISAWNS